MGVLQEILAHKREELPALRQRRLPRGLAPRPVELRRDGQLSLITEIKRRSPSAGQLSTQLSVEQRAQVYSECGASLISVLCDERFFDGHYEHLQRARDACPTPLLCKEFVIDECQLDAAAAYGADAVLLIVRCLGEAELPRLIQASIERGLTPLVEVYQAHEAQRAVDAGATLIGVNARDLDTLEMDAERAAQVLDALPPQVTRAHLSGVKTPDNVAALRGRAVDAALIGEVLMRQDDPRQLLDSLVQAARR